MEKSLIEHSKIAYVIERNPTNEDLIVGSMQRIANATELMAKNYLRLQQDYDIMERGRDYYMNEYEAAYRKINAMKGVITKLKKKLNSDKNPEGSDTTEDASSNTDH